MFKEWYNCFCELYMNSSIFCGLVNLGIILFGLVIMMEIVIILKY